MSEYNTGDRVKVIDYGFSHGDDYTVENLEDNPVGRTGEVIDNPYGGVRDFIWVVLDVPLLDSQIGSRENPILLWPYELEKV